MTNHPFRVDIPRAVLDDLKQRLLHARWPANTEGDGWTYGLEAGYLKELVAYWQSDYDWREQEKSLNRFPQYKVSIDGIGCHYIHVRSSNRGAIPLLLLHGFPDSFYRYHKVIDRLAQPEVYGLKPQVPFDVVVPSIPGTGFSDSVALDSEASCEVLVKLMTRVIGYSRFLAAGGDWGAMICQAMVSTREATGTQAK